MKKVIIDTNVWISFLIGHQVQSLCRILTDPRFDVYVCQQLIDELCDVANRKKIAKFITHADLNDLLTIIHAYCHQAEITTEAPSGSIRDPKDIYLLSLAETIKADYIISGDTDLTVLLKYRQTSIVKLADFKQMMRLS